MINVGCGFVGGALKACHEMVMGAIMRIWRYLKTFIVCMAGRSHKKRIPIWPLCPVVDKQIYRKYCDTICLDSVKKWQDFLQEIKFLGDGLNNSCMDFSGKEKVSCHNHIVLEGRSCSDNEQNLPESKS